MRPDQEKEGIDKQMIDEKFIYEYLYNKEIRIYNENIQQQNNIYLRKHDKFDLLQGIENIAKRGLFDEIYKELTIIISLLRENSNTTSLNEYLAK